MDDVNVIVFTYCYYFDILLIFNYLLCLLPIACYITQFDLGK